MNLKQIEAFVAVADMKSFSKAASMLYLTQPTVSAHVSSLEEELGATLFVRMMRGTELTQEGKRMYLYAKQIMELHDLILDMFHKEHKNAIQTMVVIAASTIPAQYLLPEILARYARAYPDARFSVRETDSASVIREIAEHTAEIGFTGTLPDKSHCEAFPIYEDELIVITPGTEHYRQLAKSEKKVIDWIAEEPLILRESGSGTRKEAEAYLEKSGISVGDLNNVAVIGSPEAILRSVKKGVGITILSKLAAQEAIDAGEVLGFSFGRGEAKRNIYMVTGKGNPLSESAKRLIDLVKKPK
ncbi:MAG: LysR family transcriptional regulator [Lachnospiraceae bacterium]|nr:LysR family transcriptional regulator [Lachnospiraceae bacterium]